MAAISASVFGSFWVALGLVILIADMRAFRRAGPLRRKRTTVADLTDGAAAKLVGVVRLGSDPLRAPLSGRACAGWRISTARRRWLRWRRLDARTPPPGPAHGFYLDDGTGEVFVPTDHRVELLLGVGARAYHRPKRQVSAKLRPLLETVLATEDRPRAYRCDERALVDGMRVAVYGTFVAEPDRRPSEARSYRDREYCFVATEGPDPIRISDDRSTLG